MPAATLPVRALARRAAVFVGALTGLVGLWHGVPVRIACLRGAGAWVVVLFLGVIWQAVLDLSLSDDRARRGAGGS
jgi:hypothetical protein